LRPQTQQLFHLAISIPDLTVSLLLTLLASLLLQRQLLKSAFTDEAAVGSGDFASWVGFGAAANFGAGYDYAGLYTADASASTAGSSSFIGKAITTFITNVAGNEYLVAKSSTTFGQDNPLFTASYNLAADATTYLFGGAAGPSVDYGLGAKPSVATQAVPEPSTYATLAGLLALSFVMLRRRG
jgi:hypothetical protein